MRPARALIDLDALRHNYRLARQRHGGQALAVIKANAYGHGAVRCARALEAEVDGFAVAILEEALELRDSGITKPILVLEGVFSGNELNAIDQHDLWLVAHHPAQIEMIEKARLGRPLRVWLKMNSGMNRAGFDADAMRPAWQRLMDSGKVGDIVLMSHFARADEPDASATDQQIIAFDSATQGLPGQRSLANSAGILGWERARRDWARPGILLYGADPMPDPSHGLRPVMTLESAVMAIREIDTGAPLGYGARFHADRPTRVGLIAMGYADGYPRATAEGTPVAVNDIRTRLIGRVSMDMLTIDLTDMPHAVVGSRVELWGGNIPVNRVAQGAGTIAYELLCNVKRVRFEYSGD